MEPQKVTNYEDMTPKQQAKELLEAEISHWKHLEKGLGLSADFVKRKIGAIRFISEVLDKGDAS